MFPDLLKELAILGRDALLRGPLLGRLRMANELEFKGEDDLPTSDHVRAVEDRVIYAWMIESFAERPARHANEWIVVGDLAIDWPSRLPKIKPWSGGIHFDGVFVGLAHAILSRVFDRKFPLDKRYSFDLDRLKVDAAPPILDVVARVPAVSGIDPAHVRVNALDLGFPPDIVEAWECRVGAEFLAMCALGLLPAVYAPSGCVALVGRPASVADDPTLSPWFKRMRRGDGSRYGALVPVSGPPMDRIGVRFADRDDEIAAMSNQQITARLLKFDGLQDRRLHSKERRALLDKRKALLGEQARRSLLPGGIAFELTPSSAAAEEVEEEATV